MRHVLYETVSEAAWKESHGKKKSVDARFRIGRLVPLLSATLAEKTEKILLTAGQLTDKLTANLTKV